MLFGKLQSDLIEGRFGCYWQMSGANFFMSLRQLLDSEKKIRVLNKLHHLHNTLNFGCESTADRLSLPVQVSASSLDVQWLVDALDATALHMDDVGQEDSNVIFYVAGFIGRSISRINKCASCKALLLEDREIDVDHDENETKNAAVRQLLELADRGGLTTPTEFTYFICSFAYMIFNHIVAGSYVKDYGALFIFQPL